MPVVKTIVNEEGTMSIEVLEHNKNIAIGIKNLNNRDEEWIELDVKDAEFLVDQINRTLIEIQKPE
mgnify:CR=1 FL=1